MESDDATVPKSSDRLDSWKEIAAHLRRGVRTVQRWERDAQLPVHRLPHDKLGSVFAHKSELDAWWASRGAEAATASPLSPTHRRLRYGAVALVVLAVGVGVVLFAFRGARTPRPVYDSVAVLPFVNLSGDPSQEFIADGFTEALITELAKLPRLNVISRTSAMQFKNRQAPSDEIARRLHAGALVEGSIIRSGRTVRVTIQLIDGATDRHLWAESYDRDFTDVLSLQRELARGIARELDAALVPIGAERERPRQVDAEAYEMYLRGRSAMESRRRADVERAVDALRASIQRDPTFAAAHAALGDAYMLLVVLGRPHAEMSPLARAEIDAALALDPALPDAWASLGWWRAVHDWDWVGSRAAFRRALAGQPGSARTHLWYGMGYLLPTGQIDDALAEVRRAVELDPLAPIFNAEYALVLNSARRHEEAAAQARRTIALDATFPRGYGQLEDALRGLGQEEEAFEARAKALELTGVDAAEIARLRNAFRRDGGRGYVRALLDRNLRDFTRTGANALGIARGYARLGDKAATLLWLDRAFAERPQALIYLEVDRVFDFLRSDPQFSGLVSRLGLPLNRQASGATPQVPR